MTALSSRRGFLKTGAIGAAAVGVAAVLPSAVADAEGKGSSDPAHAGPFVAWIKDAKAGEINILVGEKLVVHQDAKLAKQLAQIAARATK